MESSQKGGNNNGMMKINNGKEEAGEKGDENLSDVINSIEKTLGVLHQLYLTVSSFNMASQLPLLHRINSLVSELDNLIQLSQNSNIQVPMELLALIDDGQNPDAFTRDVLNSCFAKNQITKGKTDSFKNLRKHLLEELEQVDASFIWNTRKVAFLVSLCGL